jgi:hypothetical protein
VGAQANGSALNLCTVTVEPATGGHAVDPNTVKGQMVRTQRGGDVDRFLLSEPVDAGQIASHNIPVALRREFSKLRF